MRLIIEDRVEQALRHLQPTDADRVNQALLQLENMNAKDLKSHPSIRMVPTTGEPVFVMRASLKLRVLFKYSDDQTLLIEDIVSPQVLQKFGGRRG
jgi:hypothetical protein